MQHCARNPRNQNHMRHHRTGASRYDVHKMFVFFDPLPHCPHLEPICTIEFPQPPSLCPLFHDPPPPFNAVIISGCGVIIHTGACARNPRHLSSTRTDFIRLLHFNSNKARNELTLESCSFCRRRGRHHVDRPRGKRAFPVPSKDPPEEFRVWSIHEMWEWDP